MQQLSQKGRARGFTIVELIVIIVVIGILAAIVIVSYAGVQRTARDNTLHSDVSNIESEIARYSVKNDGRYVNTLAGTSVVWYSNGPTNANIKFTPSTGNVIDIVASENNYCIRAYNLAANFKTIHEPVIKGSASGACDLLTASSLAIAESPAETGPPSNVPIAFVGAAFNAGNTVTIPAHQSGDLILMIASRSGSNSPPAIDPSFTTLDTTLGGSGSVAGAVGYKLAASNAESSGTWTNANGLTAVVYRNVDAATPVVAYSKNFGWSPSVNYPARATSDPSSWIVLYGFHRQAGANFTSAPGSTTSRGVFGNGTTTSIGVYDTNSGSAGWTSTNQSVAGASNGYFSTVVELKD